MLITYWTGDFKGCGCVVVLGVDRCEEGGAKYYIDISPCNRSGDPEMSTATIVTELPVKTLKEIEYWSEMEGTEKSIFLTELIDEGLHEWKMHKALSMYKDHRVTLWRAAEIAGVSLSELLAELPKQKIIFQYDMAELNEDLEYARGK
jgi:predicted HTH domain antitoxin